MQITLFTAKCTGIKANCSYPVKAVVSSAEELQKAVRADHVCASYKNNYRSIDNFQSSDCLVMDIDNDHSENPKDWITSERIASLFEDVDYALATSRSHMLDKDGKAARPKFHIYFPIESVVPNITNTFNVYLRMENGTGTVGIGDCIASISGQAMAAAPAWDGKIEIEEKATRFVIGGGMNVRNISDVIQMETMELVQRAYTDHVTGRTAISAFCRPVMVE